MRWDYWGFRLIKSITSRSLCPIIRVITGQKIAFIRLLGPILGVLPPLLGDNGYFYDACLSGSVVSVRVIKTINKVSGCCPHGLVERAVRPNSRKR